MEFIQRLGDKVVHKKTQKSRIKLYKHTANRTKTINLLYIINSEQSSSMLIQFGIIQFLHLNRQRHKIQAYFVIT